MVDSSPANLTVGVRRGAALILGSGLLAGLVAAAVSWMLPVQYLSTCQIRQRQDAVPLLESLDLPVGGGAMRALMAEPGVRERVAREADLMRSLGLPKDDAANPRFLPFYEEHVSVAPFTDPNTIVVIGRHSDPELAARLANAAASAGRALLADRVAQRRVERSKERKAKIAALEARVADVETRLRSGARGGPSFRLEAEMRVLIEAIEELRLQDAPPVPDPDPWFVESPARPGQYRDSPWRWAPILACAGFAAAFAALVWLARDVEPGR